MTEQNIFLHSGDLTIASSNIGRDSIFLYVTISRSKNQLEYIQLGAFAVNSYTCKHDVITWSASNE